MDSPIGRQILQLAKNIFSVGTLLVSDKQKPDFEIGRLLWGLRCSTLLDQILFSYDRRGVVQGAIIWGRVESSLIFEGVFPSMCDLLEDDWTGGDCLTILFLSGDTEGKKAVLDLFLADMVGGKSGVYVDPAIDLTDLIDPNCVALDNDEGIPVIKLFAR